jgi:peptide/nickel transport system ATP-binding protein
VSDDILTAIDLKKHFVIGHMKWPERKPLAVRAVDGISFSMRSGECLGLVGESGSGKSTVAYTTVGMYRPTSGRMLFEGRELSGAKTDRPQELRKAIQIVFQDPGSSLNPRQSIRQILEMPLRVHFPRENRTERIVHLLETVDLPPAYMYRYPHMLSGGEKQIVGIARALASEPRLVILDEPTSALDVSVQAKTISLLLRLQRDLSLSFLFITHDLSLMRNVASRVAIMYLGKLCEVAETAEFFRNPLHPYTQMLLSSIPVISAEEEALKPRKIVSTGEIPSPVNVPSGCSFRTRCPFSMEICGLQDPAMVEGAPAHQVRCHLIAQPEA